MLAGTQVELPALPHDFAQATAEDSFHYAWLSALLERVVSEVRSVCCEQGMQTHWTLFQERLLGPILEASDPPPLPELCARYDIADAKTASNMIVTVKRRFRSALIRHVRGTVASDERASEEVKDLLQFLPRAAQPLE